MPKLAPTELRTLRDYALTYRLHAYCPHCQHEAWLDLARIARAVGWDTNLAVIHAALRCSNCGDRRSEIRIIHDGRPASRA